MFGRTSRFTWNKSKPTQRGKKAYSLPNTDPLTYARVRRALLKDTLTTKIFSFIAITSGIATTAYYLFEKENNPEQKVAQAAGHLDADEPEIIRDGFNLLNQAVHTTVRTFSGPVELITDPSLFATQEVVAALYKNLNRGDSDISQQAITWLIRFTDPSLPTAKKTRDLLLQVDPNLTVLSGLLTKTNSASWLNAAHLLLNFPSDELHALSGKQAIENSLTQMVQSKDPIVLLVATEVFQRFDKQLELEEPVYDTLHQISKNKADFPERYGPLPLCQVDLLRSQGPTTTPLSLAFWTVLSAGWGKFLWSMSADMSPSYRKAIEGADKETARLFKQQFLKSRKVGTAVFALCAMDYLCTWFLKNRSFLTPEQRVLDYTNFFGNRFPYTTVMPLGQTLALTIGCLWAVKTQRFVIVPLFAIGLYNHFDLFQGNFLVDELMVKPYQKCLEDLQPKATSFVQEKVSALTRK